MTEAQRIEKLEKTVQLLDTEIKKLTRAIDPLLRMQGMAPVLDDQVMAINARSEALSRGQAA